ncbi:hypothetical protein [Crocosphaera sp. XPORK-15E]|uniref:hypothetical protein n=1 Tax=Crocosphaera sp. XPORK-15E TaxID=3110247 RepID=UPI002B210B39|nr:hypothetical protein [Crocosphaera sp. XPORK-15E]MEA5534158.1 hypothetical protein [Crocosphaera sp. XPORK-15E]
MSKEFEPLFISDSDYHNNALLNFQDDMSYGYIEGYKRAADFLVIQVNEKQIGRDRDFLVYPIVFLYRQHIELLLKDIINNGHQLLNNEIGHPKHHEIDKLWLLVKDIVNKVSPEEDPEEFKLIDHVIKELSEADPKSMSFRYSKDKSGQKSNPGLSCINLRHLGQTIDEVSSFLYCIRTDISHSLDQQNEYDR